MVEHRCCVARADATSIMTGGSVLLGLCLLALVISTPLEAQSSVEVVSSGLQFNFSNPGARSLRLGGAFNALAHDSTAAYTNPAGLTRLSEKEITLETRNWQYTSYFADRGHGLGPSTGIGFDTIDGVREGRSSDQATGLSFASFVYPRENWAVAVFRHELANFSSTSATHGVFAGGRDSLSRFYPSTSMLQLDIATYGVAGAWQMPLGDRELSIGVAIGRSSFQLNSRTDYYDLPQGNFFGAPTNDRLVFVDTQEGSDAGLSFNVGALWKLNQRLSVGGVYRRGTEFNLKLTSVGGAGTEYEGYSQSVQATFRVPDVIGCGIAYSLDGNRTTVSLDLNRVFYSQLVSGFVVDEDVPNLYRVEDGTEIRLGIERILALGRVPLLRRTRFRNSNIAVGIGTWKDPDHQVFYDDSAAPQSLLFDRGEDDYHYAAGASFTVGPRVEISAALDYSRQQRIISVSTVTRLGRLSF